MKFPVFLLGALLAACCQGRITIDSRKEWTRISEFPEAESVREKAELFRAEAVPELTEDKYRSYAKTGRRGAWIVPFKRRLEMLETLTLAECFEDRGRYLPKIRELLEAMIVERSWVFPFHDVDFENWDGKAVTIDLGTAARAGEMALSVAWLAPRLDSDLVARVKARIREKALDPYLAEAHGVRRHKLHWWFYGKNNWNPVCHSGILAAASVLCDDDDERREFARIAVAALSHYRDNFSDDGYCEEGLAYWNYGFGAALRLVLEARQNGVDAMDGETDRKFKGVARYACGIQMARGEVPLFSDTIAGTAPEKDVLAMVQRFWPGLLPSPADIPLQARVAQAQLQTVGLLCFDSAAVRESCGESPGLRTWFADNQVYVGRSMPGKEPVSVALKGGHNGASHNHNDIGSLVVHYDGVEFVSDPGSPAYNSLYARKDKYDVVPFAGSLGHAVPRVGKGLTGTQRPGARHAGRVVRTSFSNDIDEVVLDLSGAYEGFRTGAIVRTLRFDRLHGVVTVSDRFDLDSPSEIDDPIITWRQVQDGGSEREFFLCSAEGPCMKVETEVSGGSWQRVSDPVENSDRSTCPTRVAVRFDSPVRQATVTWRLVGTRSETVLFGRLPAIFHRAESLYRRMLSRPEIQARGPDMRVPQSVTTQGVFEACPLTHWTSGFFPGSLWYLFEATGDGFWKEQAKGLTDEYEAIRHYNKIHDIGFMLYCSVGNGWRLTGDPAYKEILLDGAAALSSRFNSKLGLLRSWGNPAPGYVPKPNEDHFPVIVDNMMNIELLEWASKNGGAETFDRQARSHAHVTDARHFRADGSARHVVDYEPETGAVRRYRPGQGASLETAWSRGHSWGIYGFTMMYRETGEKTFLSRARRSADFAMSAKTMPKDGVPYWDYGAPAVPKEPRDASAAAIMASALLELADCVQGRDGDRYRRFAIRQLLTLSSDEYLAKVGENSDFILKHSVGALPLGIEIDSPENFADYYYLEALLRFREWYGRPRVQPREGGWRVFRGVADREGFADIAAPDALRMALGVRTLPRSPFVFLEFRPTATGDVALGTFRLPEIKVDRSCVSARSAKVLGSGGLTVVGERPVSYENVAVAEPLSRRGVVYGWLGDVKASGLVSVEPDSTGGVLLKAEAQYGNARSRTSGDPTETLAFGAFDDCRFGLEAYADEIARRCRIVLPKQPVGYCTWYADRFGHAGSAESTRELARQAVMALKPWGFGFIQIDDYWQKGIRVNGPAKDFSAASPKGPYPEGMRKTACGLRELGLVPGLWYMPFAGTRTDSAFAGRGELFVRAGYDYRRQPKDHPYLMEETRGEPYECFWGGTCLDCTRKDTLSFVRGTAARIVGDWQYGYLKFDGMWTALGCRMTNSQWYRPDDYGKQTFSDAAATGVEAYRRGVSALREGTGGRAFLLACNLPQNMRTMGASYGLVDACRIGPDNGTSRERLLRGPVAGTTRYYLNGRVWYNDPDPVYVRDTLPIETSRMLASWTALSGQLFTFSDWLGDLSEERVEILRRTMAPHGRYRDVRPVDLFESGLPRVWHLADGDRHVLGFFNWKQDSAVRMDLELSRLSLKDGKEYAVFDFWQNRRLPPVRDRISVELGPSSCRVLSLVALDDRPRILSTSRHVASPVFDVERENWDGRRLSVRSHVVTNESYEVRLAVPKGFQVVEASGMESVSSEDGLRLRCVPRSPVLDWTVEFKRQETSAASQEPVAGRGLLLLTFDDHDIDGWTAALPTLERHGAQATFFFRGEIDAKTLACMSNLVSHGQSIGLHGRNHLPVVQWRKQGRTLESYFDAEVKPQLEACRRAGFRIRNWAYPGNQRDGETDAFFARWFERLRAGAGFASPLSSDDRVYVSAPDIGKKLLLRGVSVGNEPDEDECRRVLTRLARNDEALVTFSHRILANQTAPLCTNLAWLEHIISEAHRLGVRVRGFDSF